MVVSFAKGEALAAFLDEHGADRFGAGAIIHAAVNDIGLGVPSTGAPALVAAKKHLVAFTAHLSF